MDSISMSDLLRKTREITDGLTFDGKSYVLTKNRTPICVMLPVEKYRRLVEEIKHARKKT